ncbi:hypothetical protein SAMN05443247_07619 [Bradyrhizobium erythrophlei]|nr:hypothetical protein SAMN05443247_07619 [Bradyrhizobium erythrophlei]
MVNPDAFKPLLPAARAELARQINEAEPNAQYLVATGIGWSLAIEITRQIVGGGNPALLQSFGLSAQVARAIGIAVDDAIARRISPVAVMPGLKSKGNGNAAFR